MPYSRLASGVYAVMLKAADYSVAPGDTLSAIAKRHGTTVNDISRLNGIGNPNMIRVGQRIRLPERQAIGLNAVSNELHRAFNNPNLEAAILANINRETGGTFDYRTWQRGYNNGALDLGRRQKGGYGLFQLTGPNLAGYKAWLGRSGAQDSAASQIGYMKAVYGPSRAGWKANTAPGSGLTREQLSDWWHRSVETPAHTIRGTKDYSPAKTLYHTIRHNRFMKNAIRQVDGIWTGVQAGRTAGMPN